MSILFVLLTFLVIMMITYFMKGERPVVQPALAAPSPPQLLAEHGFDIPKSYCFHPGHTWALDEGRQNARVGIDSFAARLFGKLDRVEIVGLNRWVRQGQKLMTVTRGGMSVNLLSPMEGIVIAVNPKVLNNPSLAVDQPYTDGWIAVIKSPDLNTNLKNLVQGPLVAPWMQNTVSRISTLAMQAGATMADGGLPAPGLLAQLDPGTRLRVINEMFLT
jgi:glycine cleavage system H lipoate-binding protein